MEKISKDDLKKLIDEIKKFNKENGFKEEASNITVKELLFFYLAQHQALENRVTKIEITQKNFCWFIGIALSIIGLMLVIL